MKQATRLVWLLAGCTPLSSASEVVVFEDARVHDDAGLCPSGGRGTLSVVIELPGTLDGDVTVADSDGLRQLAKSEDIPVGAGYHTVRAYRVVESGSVVGRAYYPEDGEQRVCVAESTRAQVKVRYLQEPGSQKLWTTGGAGSFHTASFALDALEKSGTPTPSATIAGAVLSPGGLAFDAEGTLWIADVAGKVHGYERDSLGLPRSSSNPDILIEGKAVCGGSMLCGPRALAFDRRGDLWLALPDRVVRIERSELVGRNQPETATLLTGSSIKNPQSLAFDESGALWIGNAGDSSVVRFDASRLAEDDSGKADVTLLGQALGPVFSSLSNPSSMAFDTEGNLWVGYLAPSQVVRYSPEELAAGGAIAPALQLSVDGLGAARGLALDEAGNLWLTGESKVTRIAKSNLMTGGNPRSSAIVMVVEGVVEDIAFDPPPTGTPLLR